VIPVAESAIRTNLSQDALHGFVAITTIFRNPALIVMVPREPRITLSLVPPQSSAKLLWVDPALLRHLDRRDHGHLATSL
jgi:hypothetical protein